MRINNISYLLKEGIRGIFIHGFMSFAAVFVTIASLLIVGIFSSLMYNLNIMVEDLNRTNEVVVYINDTLSDAEARSVGTKINMVINVQSAKFVSREEALEDFIKDNGGDDAFVGVEASDLRHRYVVTLENNRLIEDTVKQLEKLEGVDKVSAAFELAKGFSTIQDIIRVVSIVIIVVLLIVSLMIISNTVKLATYDRKDEIAIMRMVGATNGFIRFPFVVEGLILGMLGALAAFCLEWVLYDAMIVRIEQMDALKMFSFVPFTELLVPMIAIFGGAGIFVGLVGGWSSIRKFMDV